MDSAFIKGIVHTRCFLLTVVIIASMLISPVLPPDSIVSAILVLFCDAALLVAPYFISRDKRLFYITLLIGTALLLSKVYLLFIHPSAVFEYKGIFSASLEVISLSFEILLVACVMHYSIVTEKPHEPIFGCILTYLLLGLVFGNIYSLIQTYSPGAFSGPDQIPLTHNDLHYMSFITLSTCGFGDIVPRLPFARAVTCLEAICGILYVALFIGRTISNISQRNSQES